MPYELKTTQYQGPLEKLLELIETRELPISQVSLAEVTADFLSYLEEIQKEIARSEIAEQDASGLIADFIVVASKLVLIKAKSVLPSLEFSEEEEGDVRDLETRLALYKTFKETHAHITSRWSELPQLFGREFLSATDPLFYPPQALSVADLAHAIRKVVGEIERFMKPTSTIKAEIINLKSKIEEVLHHLTATPTSFHKMRSKETKRGAVILFLAILHLIKQQLVQVEQKTHFSDITVKRVSGV